MNDGAGVSAENPGDIMIDWTSLMDSPISNPDMLTNYTKYIKGCESLHYVILGAPPLELGQL